MRLRNQLIASPRFQRWAAGFPLTRGISHRRARALFDLCAGFVYSQTLKACVQLGLFEALADGPLSVAELAARMDLSPDAARRLLRAAASLGLLRERARDRYDLADLGAAMLGNPNIAAFVAHHELLYDDLRDPVALLRGEGKTRLASFWPYAGDGPGVAAAPDGAAAHDYQTYCALMSRSQALVAEDILDAYPLGAHRRLLDVGGGEGVFIAAAAARAPHLALTLFDLPPVAQRAASELARRGLGPRVDVIAGSFLSDPLPIGADIVSLVRVLHDHDDESARLLLTRIYTALPAGGMLLLAEPMSGTPGAEPIGDAYFGFYLLAMGRGRPRTSREIAAMMREAGFVEVRPLKTKRPILTSALVGSRV